MRCLPTLYRLNWALYSLTWSLLLLFSSQVFLLDCQRGEAASCRGGAGDRTNDDRERSYVFLLYPPDIDHSINPDVTVTR